MATAVLDTNSLGATGAALALTTETIVCIYVKGKTGAHTTHLVEIEISPDGGTTWMDSDQPVLGEGCHLMQVVATDVRAKVVKVEGATSTVDVWLLAR